MKESNLWILIVPCTRPVDTSKKIIQASYQVNFLSRTWDKNNELQIEPVGYINLKPMRYLRLVGASLSKSKFYQSIKRELLDAYTFNA